VLPEAAAPASFASPEPEAQARHTKAVGGPRVAWRLRALAPSQANSRSEPSPHRSQPSPAEDPADERRLPIYEAVESDWFSTRRTLSGAATAAGCSWEAPAESGWDAARTVPAPAASGVTAAGLPVRAPRANLVPGAIGRPRPDATGPVRSADAARTRLAGFQRGTGRGRAACGYDGQDPAR
jgi:hypothetical protein